jgi:hypothetical protein
MWGLSTSRPQHCLKIGAQALVWGEAIRTWRGRYRYHCVLSPTPTGAIKLSPMDLNLTDMATVESRLQICRCGRPCCNWNNSRHRQKNKRR